MSTDEINKVKEALKAQGHNPGPMNGKLDAETQQALRQFQQANNLPVTGTIDSATAAKLGVTISSQPRSTPGSSPDSTLKGRGELSPTPKPGPDSSLPGGKGPAK
jgi:peptidoglycan hydrolase-like protein with peptidoglycan-binding domain